MNPFHLAIPVNDLIKATYFYQNILGCERGRSSNSWIDFNLFGHQLVCHYVENAHSENINPVDGDQVPVPHFGVILSFDQFDNLLYQLKKKINLLLLNQKFDLLDNQESREPCFSRIQVAMRLNLKLLKT
jgi:extradiol dioxygenase family protein